MKYLKPASLGRVPRRRKDVSAYVAMESTSMLTNTVMSSLDMPSRLMPAPAKSISA